MKLIGTNSTNTMVSRSLLQDPILWVSTCLVMKVKSLTMWSTCAWIGPVSWAHFIQTVDIPDSWLEWCPQQCSGKRIRRWMWLWMNCYVLSYNPSKFWRKALQVSVASLWLSKAIGNSWCNHCTFARSLPKIIYVGLVGQQSPWFVLIRTCLQVRYGNVRLQWILCMRWSQLFQTSGPFPSLLWMPCICFT